MQSPILPPENIQNGRSGGSETRSDSISSSLSTIANRSSTDEKSSLDITQRIERKIAQYNASQNTFKRWIFEILSWTVSAACMGAIIGILVHLRDQPLNKWPIGLTVTTVLSKVASAALILPISEAIGQLKWAWFTKRSKEIVDFEIFDKASRGPWGSMMLLIRTKGKSLAALGALLTLLLLAIDTFFQQVTELPEKWVLHGNSSIARTIRYDPKYGDLFRNDDKMQQTDPNIQTITRAFFYENGTLPVPFGNGTQPDVPINCPTSKCEWEPYETLGVCSSCTDVSDILTFACLDTRLDWLLNLTGVDTEYTYPNGTACGWFLNATSEEPILMSGYRMDSHESGATTPGEVLLMRTLPLITNPYRKRLFGGSINYKDVYLPIVDALIVSAMDGLANNVYQHRRPVAQECLLSWCVKTIHSSYSYANYEEEVVDTFMNTSNSELPYPWLVTDEGWGTFFNFDGNISIYPPTADKSTAGFGVSNDTFANIVDPFDELFPGFMTAADASAQPRIRIKFYNQNSTFWRLADFSPWMSPNNVTNHMERLATAMTNIVRSNAESNSFIIGKAFTLETYISVNWEWLTFPIALLLLCLIFLSATIYKTSSAGSKETGIWKTSAMPTLIYSLPKDMQRQFSSPVTWADSSQASTKVRVKLLPKEGWRVSGQAFRQSRPEGST